METIVTKEKDPKVSYIENFVSEIESTFCGRGQISNPDHVLTDDVRDYLIRRESLNLLHHLIRR